jgi:chorismate mutase
LVVVHHSIQTHGPGECEGHPPIGGFHVAGPAAATLAASARMFPVDHNDPRQELLRLRSSIDNLDAALVHLLAERFKCTEQVGRLKARAGMPPADPAREAVQIARLRSLSESSGLDPAFAEKFLNVVISEVIRNHKQFLDEAD